MNTQTQDKKIFFGTNPQVPLEDLANERTIVKTARVVDQGNLALTLYCGIDHGFRDSTGQYGIVLPVSDIPEFLAETGFQAVENIAGKMVVAHYATRNKEDLTKEYGRDLSARTLHAVSREYAPDRVTLD